MTDPDIFSRLGCNTEIAKILARQIHAGQCDPSEICGVSFCDYESLEIARQVNGRRGDAQALMQLGVLPEMAKAIADAIDAAAWKDNA